MTAPRDLDGQPEDSDTDQPQDAADAQAAQLSNRQTAGPAGGGGGGDDVDRFASKKLKFPIRTWR